MAVTVEELLLVFEAKADQALRTLKNVDKRTKDLREQVKKMGRQWKKSGVDIDKAAKNISRATLPLSAAILGIAAVSIKTAAAFETQQVAFSTLLGSVKEGTKLFEELKQFSAETPLQLGDITKGAQALLAFGVGVEDVQNKLRQLGDVSQGNSQRLERLVNAYGKLRAKGKATMEEINRFTENGVPLIGQLSKGIGVSTAEIIKMVSQGKIGFKEVDQALTALTGSGGQFEGMMEKISQTVEGKASTALDNLKLAGADLFKVFLPGIKDALNGVIKLAQGFINLEPETKKLILGIGGVTIGITALSAAVAFLSANPIVAAIAGVALLTVGVIGLVNELAKVQKETKLVDGQTLKLIKNYQELAEKTDRTAEEQSKLEKTTKKLKELYPDMSAELVANSANVASNTTEIRRNTFEVLQNTKKRLENLQKVKVAELEAAKARIESAKANDRFKTSLLGGFGSAAAQGQVGALQKTIEKLDAQIADATKGMETFQEVGSVAVEQVNAKVSELNDSMTTLGQKISDAMDKAFSESADNGEEALEKLDAKAKEIAREIFPVLEATSRAFGETLIKSGGNFFEAFKEAGKAAVATVIESLGQQALAQAAIEAALFNFPKAAALTAAGFGAFAGAALVRSFADGGRFTATQPETIRVGDNSGQNEIVQVTPTAQREDNESSMIMNQIFLDRRVLFEVITQGARNKEVRIDAGAIV